MQAPSLLQSKLVPGLHLAHSVLQIRPISRAFGSESMVQISRKNQAFLLRHLVDNTFYFSQTHTLI